MIYIGDFEAVQKTHYVLSCLKTRGEYTHSCSFFKQYLTQLDEVLNTIWGGSFDAQLTVI